MGTDVATWWQTTLWQGILGFEEGGVSLGYAIHATFQVY
jgi:hypothetical protein